MTNRIMTKGFDLHSSNVGRVWKYYTLSRVIPMGMNRGGAGFRCLFVFGISHLFGRPIFWFTTRFESQFAQLYKIKTRLLD